MSFVFPRLAKQYSTPKAVQRLLRKLPYNKTETLRSALSTWKVQKAHCFEATLLAAAILEQKKYPPLVVSLMSQDYLDHVLWVFQQNGKWGAVARSRDEGLHGRQPIFRSIRDLVWSYVDPFVDLSGRITGYALANLDDSGCDWRHSRSQVWKAEAYLNGLKHKKIISSQARYQKRLSHFKKHHSHPIQPYWW